MADTKIELTRRRVLGALGTIGVTSAVAGAGTMAAFSDEEQSTDNSIGAGTLNLTTGSSSDGSSFNISVSNLAPGQEAEVGYLDLKNSGSIDGYLDYEITGWSDYENGRNDAEVAAGDGSGGNPGPGAGELSNFLEFRAFVDRTPGNGVRNNGTAITSGYVGLSTGIVPTDIPVAAGETIRIWIDARIPSSVGDRIQSDSTEVDAAFHLTQNQ
jgi:predicted ribosomally synthesized peptide with SipW-like signal peptide